LQRREARAARDEQQVAGRVGGELQLVADRRSHAQYVAAPRAHDQGGAQHTAVDHAYVQVDGVVRARRVGEGVETPDARPPGVRDRRRLAGTEGVLVVQPRPDDRDAEGGGLVADDLTLPP